MLSWLQGYVLNGVVQRTVLRLRAEVEDKLNRLPLPYFDGQPRGEVLSRVTNDIDNISQTLSADDEPAAHLAAHRRSASSTMMFVISPLLALIALVTIPVSIFVTKPIAKRSQGQFIAQWKTTGQLNAHIEEAFTGHELVKVFGRQREVEEGFAEHNEALYDASFGAQFISGLIMPSMMFVGNLNYVAVAVVGGLRVASGALSLGDVQAFIQYSRQFTQPLTQVASMANLLQSGVASAERVFDLLDADEQTPGPGRRRGADRSADGRVAFERRLVPLPARHAAHRRRLARRRAGPHGRDRRADRRRQDDAGEPDHALLRARLRADHPRRRRHRRPCAATSCARQIGMVLQDTWLFGGTIRDNIAYGRPGATEAEILEAARATLRRPIRAVAARRLRHRARRRVQQPQRRAEAARSRSPARSSPQPALLILDEATSVGRHPHRVAGPACDGGAAREPDQLRDRAPAVDDPRRRPDPGDGPTAGSSSRAPTTSCSNGGGAYEALYRAQFSQEPEPTSG